MTEIWLPEVGLVPFEMVTANNAVEEYDPDLMLGRNRMTGDWAVLIKRGPHEGRPFPVFNLGPELPPAAEIQRRLYQSDVRRRGHKIVEDIERRNAARRKELDDAAHDAGGEVAEAVDWAFHKMKRHPVPRIFVPKGV